MIQFHYEKAFQFQQEKSASDWIKHCISTEGFELGEINYIFCDDDYLLKLNVEFLQHDTLTDIISFDNTLGKLVSGDIYISIDRVEENAELFNVSFLNELHRVMIHGVLHYMGYKDASDDEKKAMRKKEDECLSKINY